MKIAKIAFTSALLASTAAFGTSVNFTVEESFVFDGTTAITKSNGASYTALGVFGDLSGLDFSSAGAFASGLASFSQEEISLFPSSIPVANVWSESVDSGSAGNTANLIIFDGTDLSSSSSWGVVKTSFVTQALGSETVGFQTTNYWDSAYAGTLVAGTSFTLAAVPEPSTYAMLSGLCVLGFAALRRRRA